MNMLKYFIYLSWFNVFDGRVFEKSQKRSTSSFSAGARMTQSTQASFYVSFSLQADSSNHIWIYERSPNFDRILH